MTDTMKKIMEVAKQARSALTVGHICALCNRNNFGNHDMHELVFQVIRLADADYLEARNTAAQLAKKDDYITGLQKATDRIIGEKWALQNTVKQLQDELKAARTVIESNDRKTDERRSKILDALSTFEDVVYDA